MTDPRPVRTRFAPSPSGHLHVGGARTALFCWAFARGRGGQFILRIEDTDRKRSSDAAALAFLDDLAWLGIDWDEGPEAHGCGGGERGPYRQSERRALYDAAFEKLIAGGHAYRAFETAEELDAARAAARVEKREYRYDRAALALDPATVAAWVAEGRPHAVRFRVPDDEAVVFEDAVRGTVRVEASELDDFVIRKADGFPTYHFAVVVDDEHMQVSHVIRAQEHLNNTVKHVLLQAALGYTRPVYAHVSLIFNPDGSKMSKRDKDKTLRRVVKERGLDAPVAVDEKTWAWWQESKDHQLDLDDAESLAAALDAHLPEINIDDFRRAGYLPEVMINYLALLGWSPGEDVEKFDRAFLLERFDLDRVVKSPAKFDREKLLAFNLDALQAMPEADFVAAVRAHAEAHHPAFLERLDEAAFARFAVANKERSKTLDDPFRDGGFFVAGDDTLTYARTKAVRKALVNGEPNGFAHLAAVRETLAAVDVWSVETLEPAVQAYADNHAGGKLGKIAQPLRIAVSGGTISPAIFDTLVILGRDAVLRRIDRLLAHREAISTPAETVS
ncbi:MAG: glutamate--tRNA ligase [Phycisphaerales bacterium]|nr:glutamate--tRNA ligase [Phycisphaerales bacterium]NNM26092.1 glutamate--tRNA ligase [Phycisphaerales bacterium]